MPEARKSRIAHRPVITASTAAAPGPFNRLPVEILREIFEWASIRSTVSSTNWAFVGPLVWQPVLTQICRQWRAVALETANVWRYINVFDESMEWLKLLLARSHNRTLDVGIHCAAAAQKALPLLEPHSHRLRLLAFEWPVDFDDDTNRNFKICRAVLRKVYKMDLPKLEEFRFDFSENPVSDRYIMEPYKITGLRAPSLEALYLKQAYVAWKSPLFRQLRVLHLEDIATPEDPAMHSLDAFLEVIQRCSPQLEELTLSIGFPLYFPEQESHRPASERVVELPRLRAMRLVWDKVWATPCEVFQFLQHMRVPARAALSITIDYERGNSRVEDHALFSVIPRDSECLPILRTATSMHVRTISGKRTMFSVYSETPGSTTQEGGLNLEIINHNPTEFWQYPVDEQLTDFCAVFAGAPISRLSIDMKEFGAEGLIGAFRNLNSLKVVEVQGALVFPRAPILVALEATQGTAEVHGPKEENVRPVVPGLRQLWLRSLPWHPQLLRSLDDCLDMRSKYGTELTNLRLEVFGRESSPEGDAELEEHHQLFALQMWVQDQLEIVDVPAPGAVSDTE
ncbi:hypothetical protein C8Q79DRAFT_1014807 [Trametes meyenii]|nr:hypothetical protein C8Q79DRAFT_1014807 [Trametes meyenii]